MQLKSNGVKEIILNIGMEMCPYIVTKAMANIFIYMKIQNL